MTIVLALSIVLNGILALGIVGAYRESQDNEYELRSLRARIADLERRKAEMTGTTARPSGWAS